MFGYGYSPYPVNTSQHCPWTFEGTELRSHHVFRVSKGLRTLAVEALIVDVVDFADRNGAVEVEPLASYTSSFRCRARSGI